MCNLIVMLAFTGENLALTALTLDELALEGEIHAVEFVPGGEEAR